MANFKDDIIAALGEDMANFEYIRIESNRDGYDWDKESIFLPYIGKLLNWSIAAPLLDYKYDDGFGGQDCNNITIWTKTKVYYIHEYDGSTSIYTVDRNPVEFKND